MSLLNPTPSKVNLIEDEDRPKRKNTWAYNSLLGILNFLASTTRLDIIIAVHKCVRLAWNPKLSHEKHIKRSIKYLIGTKYIRIHVEIDKTKGLSTCADAHFAITWNKMEPDNLDSMLSWSNNNIYLHAISVAWYRKLQSRISLSSTEVKFNALSIFFRAAISTMNLINENSSHLEINTQNLK